MKKKTLKNTEEDILRRGDFYRCRQYERVCLRPGTCHQPHAR